MKSEIITIDNHENGFSEAVEEAQKVAAYTKLNAKDSLHLQLCTEEVLSLVRSITGEIKASFWIETEGRQYDLHVSTKTAMDMEKRSLLLSVATSRKNEAAKSFIGMLRDIFEETMVIEVKQGNDIRSEVLGDLAQKAYALWLKGESFPEEMSKMLEELKALDEQLNDLLLPFRHLRDGKGMGSLFCLRNTDQPKTADPSKGNLTEFQVLYGDTYSGYESE